MAFRKKIRNKLTQLSRMWPMTHRSRRDATSGTADAPPELPHLPPVTRKVPRCEECKVPRKKNRDIRDDEYHKISTALTRRSELSINDIVRPKECYIAKIPNEILTNVMRYLYNNEAAFFCLRQVNYHFRSLVNIGEFKNHVFSTYHACTLCNNADANCPEYGLVPFPWKAPKRTSSRRDLKEKVMAVVNKDLLCHKCLDFERSLDLSNPWKFPEYIKRTCKFSWPPLGIVPCAGCEWGHPAQLFSVEEQAKPAHAADRMCVGREGFVRLCDHVKITWAEIEKVVVTVRGQEHGGQPLRIWEKRCSNTCHSRGEYEAKPTAELFYHRGNTFELRLSWKPKYAFSTYKDGQIDASEMRSVFRGYRKDAARFIHRSHDGSLPEMQSFDQSSCNCLRNEEITPGSSKSSSQRHSFSPRHHPIGYPWTYSSHQHPGDRACGISHEVILWKSDEEDNYPVPIIQTNYSKRIMLEGNCWWEVGTDVATPPDGWLHALDPDSYNWAGPRGVRETCRDVACKNYYKLDNCFHNQPPSMLAPPRIDFEHRWCGRDSVLDGQW